MSNAPDREILVILKGGRKRLIKGIPGNAKVTYGPVSPGRGDFQSGNALRIYTSQSNQLLVMTNVEEFRDLTLEVKEQVSKSKSKRTSLADSMHLTESFEVDETWEWEE